MQVFFDNGLAVSLASYSFNVTNSGLLTNFEDEDGNLIASIPTQLIMYIEPFL